MDDYKIVPDEKEMRMEKRKRELDEFKRRTELERAERNLLKMTRVGLCAAKSVIGMVEGELWYEPRAVFGDKRVSSALKDFIHATTALQEAMDAAVRCELPEEQTTFSENGCWKRTEKGEPDEGSQ